MKRRRSRRDWNAGEPVDRSPVWVLVTRMAAGFLVLAIVATGIAFLVPEMRRRDVLDTELGALERIRGEVQAERNRKQHELALMENDPAYFENVAREVLDRARPEESVIRIRRDEVRPAEPPAGEASANAPAAD